MTSSKRDLFGGAITADAPAELIDVSDLRQVPDTQEAFLYPESSVSIVVEVLEKVAADNLESAARFHFDSLAHDNSAHLHQVEMITTIQNERGDATPSVVVLSGTQKVSKYNRNALDDVRILLGLYRVESKNIDLVVSFNIPLNAADGGAVDEEGLNKSQADFDVFVRSLRIVDFGLFA
ncbi:hypothetical protein DL96DRAFT_1577555 [Flagelloscypha sp. PMI_526]|nr:hypothetical protein DL96DRAFT_1577555 [Flagelloscypha sp. PMI_526]